MVADTATNEDNVGGATLSLSRNAVATGGGLTLSSTSRDTTGWTVRDLRVIGTRSATYVSD